MHIQGDKTMKYNNHDKIRDFIIIEAYM
ncbi:MarR family transcriptional regulator, partial [Staphylococcus aureus]